MARKNDNDDFFNLEEFTNDLVEEMVVEERQFAVETFMKAVTQPTNNAQRVEGKTPILSGKLMANTIVSVGAPDERSYENYDVTGKSTYLKGVAVASKAPAYSEIYIQNNAKDEGDKDNYSFIADQLGWYRKDGNQSTPPYRFFTLSAEKMFTEVEKRK